ncbi:MAG TPA: hypothetical protein VFU93_04680 [Acidimicrobiales bacterium]|nr:hypothetical protein [Acidimicrobiales bacterium]
MKDQLTYDPEELLASHDYEEPLVLAGRRMHGGFDADGTYRSPRTRNRIPAIEAWQAKLAVDSGGMPLVDCPPDFFAAFYPNVDQTTYLLSEGVRTPLAHVLTHIGTIEGFGSIIRFVELGDLQARFVEPIDGTAMAHLQRGLYEAHARDESGFEDEGGHQQMWYLVRDLALEDPDVGDPLALTMKTMAADGAGSEVMTSMAQSLGGTVRVVPQIDEQIELAITRMTGLLLIELLAENTFRWAEQVVGDERYCANAVDAARLVNYIRMDEAPHVEYLRTTLTEMRARTFVGVDGQHLPGTDVIDACWDYSMKGMFGLGGKRQGNRAMFLSVVERELEHHPRRATILSSFHDLETADPVIDEPAPPKVGAVPSY